MKRPNVYMDFTGVAVIEFGESAPDDVVDRVFNEEWASQFFHMENAEDVYRHWVYNAIENDIRDISGLEGWADVSPTAVVISLEDIDASL